MTSSPESRWLDDLSHAAKTGDTDASTAILFLTVSSVLAVMAYMLSIFAAGIPAIVVVVVSILIITACKRSAQQPSGTVVALRVLDEVTWVASAIALIVMTGSIAIAALFVFSSVCEWTGKLNAHRTGHPVTW